MSSNGPQRGYLISTPTSNGFLSSTCFPTPSLTLLSFSLLKGISVFLTYLGEHCLFLNCLPFWPRPSPYRQKFLTAQEKSSATLLAYPWMESTSKLNLWVSQSNPKLWSLSLGRAEAYRAGSSTPRVSSEMQIVHCSAAATSVTFPVPSTVLWISRFH